MANSQLTLEGLTDTKPCAECATPFVPRRQGPKQKYCSSRCRARVMNRSAKKKLWKEKNVERLASYSRRHHLQKTFGLSVEDYDAKLAEQGGVCAICGTDDTSPWDWFCIDHDHDTGQVRGLLCRACNTCIGQALDDPERLRSAAAYIEAWRA